MIPRFIREWYARWECSRKGHLWQRLAFTSAPYERCTRCKEQRPLRTKPRSREARQ
jgi:hypothetical protein